MNQQLDEKRDVIISILTELRSSNPRIGYYERSIMGNNFNYLVKLNNGRIEIPATLVEEYEKTPSCVTVEKHRHTAARFIGDQYPYMGQRLQHERHTLIAGNQNEPGSGGNKKLVAWAMGIVIILASVMYFIFLK